MTDDERIVRKKAQLAAASRRYREKLRVEGRLPILTEEQRLRNNAAQRKHRNANLEKSRADSRLSMRKFYMRHRYNITLEQYASMLSAQGNCCAICKSETPKRKGDWHIDHDHKTGRVRGILCHPCNIAIGNSGDSPELLRAMASYLESHQ